MSRLSPWFGILRTSFQPGAYHVRMADGREAIVIESRATRRRVRVSADDVRGRRPTDVVIELRRTLESEWMSAFPMRELTPVFEVPPG